MTKIEIFEPAMCCPTGLCGVSVDPELLRISTAVNTLNQEGLDVKRYNLSNDPVKFVTNQSVSEFIRLYGVEKLPMTLVDGNLKVFGRYPTNEELESWFDLNPDSLKQEKSGC